MILVDTSVVIEHFRKYDDKRQSTMETHPCVVSGMTVAECRAGGITTRQWANTQAILALFTRFPTAETVWESAGKNQAILRSAGLTVPLPDVINATIAIIEDIELWAYDKHFPAMAALLPGLRLFQEP